MDLETKVANTLIRLGKADKETLLKAVQEGPDVNRAIGRLIDRGDFRITLL
jgi:hypothetical protein